MTNRQESQKHPEVGVFPLIEVPMGNSRLGIGNGQLWARLPVWVQKSRPLDNVRRGGYQINHAPGRLVVRRLVASAAGYKTAPAGRRGLSSRSTIAGRAGSGNVHRRGGHR